MSTRRLGLALAALFAATACVDQSPHAPSANALIVHAVLDASARLQTIVLQSTTGAISEQRPVVGATVVIVTPDGRPLIAEETRDSTIVTVPRSEPRVTTVYRVALDRYGITSLTPGATYVLRITVPDGRRVTASTTIPTASSVLVSSASQTIDRLRDTVRLAWAPVPGARAYEVFVSSPGGGSSVFADTSITLPGTASGNGAGTVFWPGTTHALVISAVDENYYDYFRRTSDFLTGAGLISHLDGAIGVFGSLVPIARRTIVSR